MKALIPCAGFGTRMLPATKSIPKELMPVACKPVIQYIIEGLVSAGINEMLMVTAQGKRSLEDHFDKNFELEILLQKKGKTDALKAINYPKEIAKYAFVRQYEQLGTANAVYQGKPWIAEEFFLVTFGDEIIHPKIFQEIVALHQQTKKSIIMLQEVSRDDVSKYGVVDIQDGKIVNIIEKPKKEEAPSNLVSRGLFILPKKIFDIIETVKIDEASGEYFLPEAIKILMQTDEVLPYVTKHAIRDVGNPQGRLQANNDLTNNPDLLK